MSSSSSSALSKAQGEKIKQDIEEMLFGFGDQWPPNTKTVDAVEVLVTEYITDLAQRALVVADQKGGLDKSCFQFLVRTDERKFLRIKRLMEANEEIKDAKRGTNDDLDQELQVAPPA